MSLAKDNISTCFWRRFRFSGSKASADHNVGSLTKSGHTEDEQFKDSQLLLNLEWVASGTPARKKPFYLHFNNIKFQGNFSISF